MKNFPLICEPGVDCLQRRLIERRIKSQCLRQPVSIKGYISFPVVVFPITALICSILTFIHENLPSSVDVSVQY